MSDNVVHFSLFLIGLILLRISGNLWWWACTIESKPIKESFKRSYKYRKYLASEDLVDEEDTTRSSFFRLVEGKKRLLLKNELRTIRWFDRHERISLFISLVGFYCAYLPANQFVVERLTPAVNRNILVPEMPSYKYAKENQITNPSILFDKMMVSGRKPLLTDEEMSEFGGTRGNGKNSSSQDPAKIKWTKRRREDLDFFLEFQKYLSDQDNSYLEEIISSDSLIVLQGDSDIDLNRDKDLFTMYTILYSTSVFLLCYIGVPFFDM